MKSKALYCLFVLLCVSVAQAVDFKVVENPVKNKIFLNELAEYQVTIINDEPNPERFKILNKDYPNWDVRTDPIFNPIIIDVPANSNASVLLYLDPNEKYIGKSGSHFLNIAVIAQSTGESYPLQPRIGIIDTEDRNEYVPTVIMETTFPTQINPRDPVEFTITLNNLNKLDIKNALLKIDSDTLQEEQALDIAPREERVLAFKKALDPASPPKEDQVAITLSYKGQNVFLPYAQNFRIVAYSSLQDVSTIKKSFLKTVRTVTFTNKGNVPFKGSFSVATTPFKKYFTTTEPEASSSKENGALRFLWYAELSPYASSAVTITENYVGVLIVIIVLLLIALLIFLKRSPLVIHKHIIETESDEGGLSRVKVLINVKNRGAKKIEGIAVIDKIPKLLEVDKSTTVGSLHPTKTLVNAKQEKLFQWNIDVLNPGEERVINYQMKSALHILGGITLPAAMATFRHNDQEKKARSNIPSVKG